MKQTNRGAQEWIRFLFAVDIPSRSNHINMAGRSFKLDFNNGADLRNFLTGLLGHTYFRNMSGQQLDLGALIGTQCEIELTHFANGEYEHPMVVVNGCHKPGTLNLTEKPAELEPTATQTQVQEKGGDTEAK